MIVYYLVVMVIRCMVVYHPVVKVTKCMIVYIILSSWLPGVCLCIILSSWLQLYLYDVLSCCHGYQVYLATEEFGLDSTVPCGGYFLMAEVFGRQEKKLVARSMYSEVRGRGLHWAGGGALSVLNRPYSCSGHLGSWFLG